jgi:hypothetical protein
MKEIFDLNYQWRQYCQMVGVPEEKMHPVQRVETKRAFMGACGQMLLLLRDDVAEYEETEAIVLFKNMLAQVEAFWKEEVLHSPGAQN